MQTISFEELPKAVVKLYEKLTIIENLLLSKELSPQHEQDQILTIQQASDFLKLTVPTIYGLVSRSAIPVSKKGKRLYFSKNELTAWIKEGRKKTIAELQSEANNFTRNRGRK